MTLRVAIAGVGNCANALVQGVTFYSAVDDEAAVPGLMHSRFGQFRIRDIEFVAAFDVDAEKVGADLASAIWASQNDTYRFAEGRPDGGDRAARSDARWARRVLPRTRHRISRTRRGRRGGAARLRRPGARLLPAGGVRRMRPGPTRRRRWMPGWRSSTRFPSSSQATRSGRRDSGSRASRSSGMTSRASSARPSPTGCSRGCSRNADSCSTAPTSSTWAATWTSRTCSSARDCSRRRSRRRSPSPSNLSATLDPDDVHIGPSDHVPWLHDRKFAFVRLEGHGFGNAPTSLEYKLEVWDSPNSAGVVIDRNPGRGHGARGGDRRTARGGIRLLHEIPGRAAFGSGGARAPGEVHRRHHPALKATAAPGDPPTTRAAGSPPPLARSGPRPVSGRAGSDMPPPPRGPA